LSPDDDFEQQQVEQAVSEAAEIGGSAGEDGLDPARRPVVEGGGGAAEGFELAEQLLVENASHGDQLPAHAVIHHASEPEDARAQAEPGPGDHERSSERGDDDD
jgi:hypothetical protein